MGDKRNYRRFVFEKQVELRFAGNPGEAATGKVLDISFTGMSIFLKENVNTDSLEGTIAEFDLVSSVEQHFTGKVRVVYVRKQRLYAENGAKIGVEFVDVPKQAVLSIIDRLEAEILAEVRRRNKSPRRDPGEF